MVCVCVCVCARTHHPRAVCVCVCVCSARAGTSASSSQETWDRQRPFTVGIRDRGQGDTVCKINKGTPWHLGAPHTQPGQHTHGRGHAGVHAHNFSRN